jgi:hypothetical protein
VSSPIKKIKELSVKGKLLTIGVIMVVLWIGFNRYQDFVKVQKFENALNTYLTSSVFSNAEYFKAYKLDGIHSKDLTVTLSDDFDKLSRQEKYDKLSSIMDKFMDKRLSLLMSSKIYNISTSSSQYLSEWPSIYGLTSNNKYKFSGSDYFTDGDGKEYSAYDMGKKSITTSSNTSSSSSTTSNYSKEPSKDNKTFAWTAAVSVVKENLKAPSTAKFPFSAISDGVTIKETGLNVFQVTAWVEAQNDFGAKPRKSFTVTIEKTGNDTYKYRNLIID